jgi:hypothetical protein
MRQPGFHWPGLAVCGALLAVAMQALQTNAPSSPLPPMPPQYHHLSPVEYFRGLLGMSPEEREQALANKSPADKAVILAKLQEYEALPWNIREARLCQTELHWELSGLMRLAPGERTNRLREVSPLYLPIVESLLRQWDNVPADTQKALLEKQSFISLYLRMQGSPAAVQQEILAKLSPERRAHWTEEMDRWQALPEQQRAELCAQFQRFCFMDGQEQKETVDTLSDDERQEMEKVLQYFNRLPPVQRTQCINAFRKFATMSPDERNQFLKNAARWEAMTARERQVWRDLVHTLPTLPPTLPGFPQGLPPMPPMPVLPPNVTAPVIIAGSTNEIR